MKRSTFIGIGLLVGLVSGCATTDSGEQAVTPFGGEDSVAYAGALWASLTGSNLVGPGALTAKPYQGTHPHGAVLVTFEAQIGVDGHTGIAIIKNNYAGETVSEASVANDPAQNLDAVTVMFKRETGYDPENGDWFWAKYKTDGSLHANPNGVLLAGRVAKGKPKGCIACHKLAPGGDYVFNHDRFAE